MSKEAWLVLEDGGVYSGRWFGSPPPSVNEVSSLDVPSVKQFARTALGEVVFNTGMAGYHEILTDPSYTGQIVVMTYPHEGNYGDTAEWDETTPQPRGGRVKPSVQASALVVRSLYEGPLPGGRESLASYLEDQGVSGISEVDTRSLTLRLRRQGAQRGMIVQGSVLDKSALSTVVGYLKKTPSMEGCNLVDELVTHDKWTAVESGRNQVALIDYGSKANIIRDLGALDCRVTVYPRSVTAEELLKDQPQLVLLSNGPGDPGVLEHPVAMARELMGKVPLSGICLGHQILARALGAETYKMKFGHHGCNHPVRDEFTQKILITSQNHGFAVNPDSLSDQVAVWHRNANDGTLEGLRHKSIPLACVQFHPEAAPGPRDSQTIFHSFLEMIHGA